MDVFSSTQLNHFKQDGFLFVPAKEAWTKQDLEQLLHDTNQVETIKHPDLMKYYETVTTSSAAEQKVLQRIEKFIELEQCATLNRLLNGPSFLSRVTDLFNVIQPIKTTALLFKEKINYKLPGGSGYKPHQDVAAGWWQYGQTLHITAYISIDHTTKANGALALVKGEHQKGLIPEQYKELSPDYCAKQTWHLYETVPGDVLFFTSFVPHQSEANQSKSSRRILYMTYSMSSEGDFRAQYFAEKRKSFPPDDERLPGQVYEYKI